MGKPFGFLGAPRHPRPTRHVEARLADHDEVLGERSAEDSREQASRCIGCGVPFCHQGCPLGNLIPEFNDLLWRDEPQAAWARLDATNNFPEITGRLCPAPCEAACVLSINDDPVTIEHIELDLAELAFAEGWVQPQPHPRPSGQSVAIVGSGPAGLAAAQQLVRQGHDVVVYERDDAPGGLLRYGIPDFKLDKGILQRRLDQLTAEGVRFACGQAVGTQVDPADLLHQHDALLLAIGATIPRDLDLPERDGPGVHFAMDYLRASNRAVAGAALPAHLDAQGKRVLILGGGDTGSDCLGTALRQGAAQVTQLELFPAPPAQRGAANPWPEWPHVFRTSSSQAEGGERTFGQLTVRLERDEDGTLVALHTVEVTLEDGALVQHPERTHRHPVDLLVLAMGFLRPDTAPLLGALSLSATPRGTLDAPGYRTQLPKVYTAGDARRGASLIVWAIAEGRGAAQAIHDDLSAHAPEPAFTSPHRSPRSSV